MKAWGRNVISRASRPVTFLGNNIHLRISLHPAKRQGRPSCIDGYLREGRASRGRPEELIGRISPRQTNIFGKFALRRFAHCTGNFAAASTALGCQIWKGPPSAGGLPPSPTLPRVLPPLSHLKRVGAFTRAQIYAASTLRSPLSGVAKGPPTCANTPSHTLGSEAVDVAGPYLSRNNNLVFGPELMALVLFFEDCDPSPKVPCFWIYVGSNNCLSALWRGGSFTEVIAVLVARCW